MYQALLRPLFFLLPAETAHQLTFFVITLLYRIPGVSALVRKLYGQSVPKLERSLFGIKFPNPVGVAAGFDKDAKLIGPLADLGFGFVEIGTVTPRPQIGNPRPRLFRLPADNALINRMGFNNSGIEEAVKRLRTRSKQIIIGGNIGKNKDTSNQQAHEDYLKCFRSLYHYVDYFVVNVSSPNTPGLRELQEREPLTELLTILQRENHQTGPPKPILLKVAPDLSWSQLDDIIEIVQETNIDGIVATNTTVERSGLKTSAEQLKRIGAGGLSGAPLSARATEIIRYIHQKSQGKIPIIGVGGITTAADAWEKIQAGASLVQVYTGLIYRGPGIVRELAEHLVHKMEGLQHRSIE